MSKASQMILVLACVLALLIGAGAYMLSSSLGNKKSSTAIIVTPISATRTPLLSEAMPTPQEIGPLEPITATATLPQSMGLSPTLLTSGTGTTTLNKATPLNDILIAETGSEYASLRNARYTEWPYPGDIPFKEIYFVLPDVYTPIFSGYSNNQFLVSSDGSKHILIRLRHSQSTDVGSNVSVTVQSPLESDEADHPLEVIDSSAGGAVYSVVKNHQEVLVEVIFFPVPSVPQEVLRTARAALLEGVSHMEITW